MLANSFPSPFLTRLHCKSPQGLRAVTKKHKYEKIAERKMATPIEILCQDFPVEFVQYFQQCRGLRFEDKPGYSYLRNLFKTLFERKGYQYDHVYDWTIMRYGRKASEQPSHGLLPPDVMGETAAAAAAAGAVNSTSRDRTGDEDRNANGNNNNIAQTGGQVLDFSISFFVARGGKSNYNHYLRPFFFAAWLILPS